MLSKGVKLRKKKRKKKKVKWTRLKATYLMLIKNWKIKLGALAFISSLVILYAFPEHTGHDILLQYLSLFFSWPILAFILILFISLTFRQAIEAKLQGLSRFKTGKWSADFQPPPEVAKIDRGEIVGLKGKIKSGSKVKGNLTVDKLPTEAFYKIAVFERAIRYMFRSQYKFLKLLHQEGPKSLDEVHRFYISFLYAGGNTEYKSETYFGWLAMWGFIHIKYETSVNMAELTPRGSEFLQYCTKMNYTELEFNPL